MRYGKTMVVMGNFNHSPNSVSTGVFLKPFRFVLSVWWPHYVRFFKLIHVLLHILCCQSKFEILQLLSKTTAGRQGITSTLRYWWLSISAVHDGSICSYKTINTPTWDLSDIHNKSSNSSIQNLFRIVPHFVPQIYIPYFVISTASGKRMYFDLQFGSDEGNFSNEL